MISPETKDLIKDNKGMSITSFDIRPVNLSKTGIYDRLMNAMGIDLPSEIETENTSCQTVAGIIEAFVMREVKMICNPISEVCFQQISYESIRQATATVNAKRDFYLSIVGECESMFNEFQNPETNITQFNSCPVDTSLSVGNDGVWIQDMRDSMFVGYGNITSTFDLLRAVRCKFSYLSYVCDQIIEIRSNMSSNTEACGLAFESYYACREELILISAQKYLDDNDYLSTTAKRRETLQAKVMKRMEHNVLYSHYEDFIYDPYSFAFYVANTEGVNNSIVADFLIDNEILKRMNNKVLSFPWLRNEYHNRTDEIRGMLFEAYRFCMSPHIGKTSTQAYTLLWYWMLSHLNMAQSGMDKGIAMFTELLNRLTGATVQASTMPKEISNNRKTDYSKFYIFLDSFAVKYGFKTLK